MRLILTAPALLLVAGVLAGCGPKSAAVQAKAPAAAAPSGASAADTPADFILTPKGAPQRRDGYWEMASYTDTGTPMAKQFYCVGAGSEQKFNMFDALSSAGNCDKKDFKRTATGWTFETRCKVMSMTTTQSGTLSGDFQQTVQVDQTVTQDGDTQKGTIRGKRVGDCPAKFKPGDLVNAHGEKLANLLGFRRSAP